MKKIYIRLCNSFSSMHFSVCRMFRNIRYVGQDLFCSFTVLFYISVLFVILLLFLYLIYIQIISVNFIFLSAVHLLHSHKCYFNFIKTKNSVWSYFSFVYISLGCKMNLFNWSNAEVLFFTSFLCTYLIPAESTQT